MVYVRTANEVFAGEKLELDKNVYILDGSHMFQLTCVERICDDVRDAIDKLIVIGTDMGGRRLPPATRDPGMLEATLDARAQGKFNEPFQIFGAIWHCGRKGEPILTSVCEFVGDEGKVVMK